MWVGPQDVQDRLPVGVADPDPAYLVTILADAESLVTASEPDLEDLVNAGIIPIDRVTMVVSRMVIRHLMNPTGVRTKAEGQGPFNSSVTYGGDSPGGLEFTVADRRVLLGFAARGRAFSVDNTPQR